LLFIAPDLRGNGKSAGKKGHFDSYEQVMQDIDFLVAESGKRWPDLPVIIYGQSMGGNLALNYCLRRKPAVKGVIASSPWLRLARPPSPIVRSVGNFIARLIPSLVISNGIDARDLSHSKVISDAYDNDPLVHGKISLNTFRIITESGEWAIRNSRSLNMPLLLMHGTADRITSMEASREFFGHDKSSNIFKTWEGLYHELHNEPGSAEVLSFMINWMNSILL
jgi:alpha-beta hydrolase superfamily lysophospholipase